MPKEQPNKSRYYTNDMSDPGRPMARERARGRSTAPQGERRDDRSSSQSGSRRPGQPPAGPSHGSGPYPRVPSSTEPPSTSYHSSARGELQRVEHRPQSAFSETTSDTASVAGSGGGEGSAAVGRGSMRGRRVLPVDIITRPRELQSKQGGHGKPIELECNYFKLLTATDWALNQYSVDFEPAEDRSVVRKGLLRAHRPTLGAYIFDGSSLFTTNNLPDPLQLTSQRQGDNETIMIKIKRVADLRRGDYQYLQFFNIIIRKCLDYLELKLVGRNYFDALNKAVVREFRLELWPGYITSMRQHEHDILMCAEITHKVMRDETLLDVLGQCYERSRHDYQKLFADQVIGCVVLTDYNNNTYRVDDVDFSVTPQSTFARRDGTEITYNEYYQTKYQIRINDMRQPLLVSKSKPRDRRAGRSELVYLVPELCRSTGLTDAMRANFKLMSALALHTRVSPADRITKLLNFNKRLHTCPNVIEEFTSWNMSLDNKLCTIPARVLPPEKINYGPLDKKIQTEVPYNANWTNDLRKKSLVKCGQLNDWVCLVPSRLMRDTQSFVTCLMRVASTMNFHIDQPHVFEMPDDSAATYANMLDHCQSEVNPMLIFCVASNNRLDRYSAIKKKCCVERPVPTQVMLAKNLSNPKSQMSIATKVAIQMNCKIGGIPWTVTIPVTSLMVVGFDVCHDTNSKEKNFGAMVASIDVNFGRYYSAVSSHINGEELSSDLSVNLCKALCQFRQYNGALPKKIVVYRDGVGEGQIPFVVKHEVEQIKSKLESVYDSPDDIKLTYIIVTKKINTRLFHNRKNPPPGTVVDDVITDPSKYDFLIVSQHVGQGTVSPTSYNIVADGAGLDVDKLQRLTYKLCHMYFNWSGTVRVPAPCQYAHKLAFLVSQAVHQSPGNTLETLLYFL